MSMASWGLVARFVTVGFPAVTAGLTADIHRPADTLPVAA